MKLERTLIELTTLVDYGTRYLLDLEDVRFQGEEMGRDMVADLSIFEFCDMKDLTWNDVLDSLDEYDIKNYASDYLDMVEKDDAKEYVRDNYDASDIYDADDFLDSLDEYTIKDYVTSHYDVEDFVGWD